MDADTLFLAAGAIIFMGFISNYLFRRFKAPDVLILMVLGITLGPGGIGLINSEAAHGLEAFTPYVAAAALAIIMFQAGMDLAIADVVRSFSKSIIQTVIAFTASMLITGLILTFLTSWSLETCLLLGAIVGGTSGAIVIPIITALRISTKLKMVLTLESAITDVLVIVVATSIIVFMSQDGADLLSGVELLVSSFLVSTMIGIISGILWTKILQRMKNQPYSYMITIAAMLIVFSATNFLVDRAGGGAIAVLVFGLTIGNWDEIAMVLKQKGEQFALGEKVKRFHDEIAFLIRTIFFVYLGLVVTTIQFTAWYLLLGLIVFFGLLIARYVSLLLADKYIGLDASDEMGLFYMMPRGLAAAVMASIPFSYPLIFDKETATAILGVTVVVVLLSTVLASMGAFYMELHTKRNGQKNAEAPIEINDGEVE
ncbi:MAG: Na(+)/H(+) antiporter 1 [Methanomassiliicoccales archaeon PtaB.Bin134]|nr:MAG: Na(+)/H(+) antiporter 1 [Methanomassiliicoccales archaeon PtaB.Bin134]